MSLNNKIKKIFKNYRHCFNNTDCIHSYFWNIKFTTILFYKFMTKMLLLYYYYNNFLLTAVSAKKSFIVLEQRSNFQQNLNNNCANFVNTNDQIQRK